MKILSLTSTFKTFFLYPNRRTSLLHVQNILKVLKIWLFLLFSSFGASIFALKKHNEQYSLKLSFSRKLSRIAGSFATITIPKFLRKPLFTLYARIYHVNLHEMEKNVESFESFNKFFTRTITPRPIHADPLSIASPADSRVLTYSEVKGDEVLIVKGIEYRLREFLTGIGSYQIKEEVLESMKRDPKNKLYHIILYLAPGDYHRYHAPTNCNFKTRNHIIGKLHPVKEKYVKTHTGVYEKNERVSLFGDWVKGLMCMVLVGALNVGSIDLNFDKSLKTNTSLKVPFANTQVKVYGEEDSGNESDRTNVNKGVQVVKGEEVGKFNLGSTVVLVFEASANFEWKVKPGEKVQYGQCIGVST